MIGDFMTIQEKLGLDLQGKKLVFVGDGRNNVARSLMVISAKLGLHFVALTPTELQLKDNMFATCQQIAQQQKGSVTLTDNQQLALQDADVVYTDVWVSMGESN